MDFLLILIVWLVLSPFLKFIYHYPFLFFLLLYGGVWFYRRRHTKTPQPVAAQNSLTDTTDSKLIDLLILCEELKRQHKAGNLDLAFYNDATKKIDELNRKALTDLHITPDNQRWRVGREAAWEMLVL